MPQDILVVDDEQWQLDVLRDLIRSAFGIDPYLATSGDEALQIMRNYRIKVLVADYLMSPSSGLELFRTVKSSLRLNVPCILITAFKEQVSAQDAVNLGLTRLIDKSELYSSLVPALREAIQRYEIQTASTSVIPIGTTILYERGLVRLNTPVMLRVIEISEVVTPYVRDVDWETVFVAQRNMAQTREVSIERKVSGSYETELSSQLSSDRRFKFGEAIAQIEAALGEKISQSVKGRLQSEFHVTVKQTISISEISNAPEADGRWLVSREYQTAPVYTRAVVLLEILCHCCRILKQTKLFVDWPTNRVALRQIERYNSGGQVVMYTGFLSGALV